MTPQLDLFAKRLVAPMYQHEDTLSERFGKFHAANPWVFAAFVTLAKRAQAQGRKRIGIGHLAEIVRWEYAGKTEGSEFKLNNSFRSRYARLICERHPELETMFEFRELKAA